jgi:hypothetical protein
VIEHDTASTRGIANHWATALAAASNRFVAAISGEVLMTFAVPGS